MADMHSENDSESTDSSEVLRPDSWAASRSGTGPWAPLPADSSSEGADDAASDRAVPILRLLSYVNAPEDRVLAPGKNTVGRHPDNDVVIDSRFVSRWHCTIQVDPNGRCFVQDLGSAAGVVVNGERIAEPVPLRYGDEIGIGNQHLVLLLRVNGIALTELRE